MSGDAREREKTLTFADGVKAVAQAGFTLPERWRVARLLGAGGQAEVWLAFDAELSEWVAVKVFGGSLTEVQKERLRREVRLGRSLSHPGLVRVFELIEGGDRLAVAMEWVQGESLARRVEAGPLPIGEVIAIAEQALDVLGFLGAQRIVHRDVKPSNLLLDAEGRLRLADLGLVRPLGDDTELTRTAMTVGTPGYMSPEQHKGEELTPASDLYSLGVTLYQLLTGKAPFAGRSAFEIADRHLRAAPPSPRKLRADCPPWLDRFVVRLLQKRPGDRFRDAAAAREALLRRRLLLSPRFRRRAAGVLIGIVLVAAAAFAAVRFVVPRIARAATVRVEAVGTEIRGLDGKGRTTWLHRTDLPIVQVDRGDVDGDGRPETVVATRLGQRVRGGTGAHSEILIVGQSGKLISRMRPDDVAAVDWPYEYPVALNPRFRLTDLDGDGRTEVIANCRHITFFPALLLVYWPRPDVWQPVLLHSGSLYGVGHVPGTTPPRLRIAGINNRLGMLPIVGEIVIDGDRATATATGEGLSRLTSGDYGLGGGAGLTWAWYTPLEEESGASDLAIEHDGSTTVLVDDHAVRLDPFGNPIPGPNAGRDLRAARVGFFRQLFGLDVGLAPLEAGRVGTSLDELEAEFAPLLAERPYRAILALVASRRYARLGAAAQAREVLEAAVREAPYEDLVFRLAHLVALEGRLAEARGLLIPHVSRPKSTRAVYDMTHLLFRLAIEERHEGDGVLLGDRLNWSAPVNQNTRDGLLATLRARAHLWWDSIEEVDCAVQSWPYAPDGEAIACLARWRLGRTAADDPEAMDRAIGANPEAHWEGCLAKAAAASNLGRHADALAGLGGLIAGLEVPSRDDFMNRQVLDLARGVYAKVLWRAGRNDQAVREARAMRPLLRDGLLPAILVDEVLAESAARQAR